MVVDHSNRLHEGIADRRTHKRETTLQQVSAHHIRFVRSWRHFSMCTPAVDSRLAADELPDVGVEAAEFVLNRQKGFRVLHGALYFQPVAHDAWIRKQSFHSRWGESRNTRRVEFDEGIAISRTLIQYGFPAQTGLSALEREELEEHPIVVHRHAPFFVVIGNAQRRSRPRA